VATVPEGLALREAGITLPVLKFSPAFPEEMGAAVRSGITLSVCDRANVEALEAVCASMDTRAAVQLVVDTGMSRLGAQPAAAPALAVFIDSSCPHLRLQGCHTHLPVSDAADPAYTRSQLDRFRTAVAAIQEALGHPLELVHCANSGGVLGHPDSWMDLVRPGIMVYGCYPDGGTPRTLPLLPGLSLFTRVSFLKKIPAGTQVGYGLTWTAPADTWIATLQVGYADGFNRLFSNRGRVLLDGRSYPVVGRVCMDQTMIDLGPETNARVGDQVVLIGRSGPEEITVDEWAQVLGTIPYEVTCQINARVERIYRS
jgi:alanine racemase